MGAPFSAYNFFFFNSHYFLSLLMRDLTRFLAAEDVCDCVDGGVAVDLAAGGGGARG